MNKWSNYGKWRHPELIEKYSNMVFRTRKLIKYEDLNARGTLFGGQVLKWIDEEAAIFCICQLGSRSVVTKTMSEVNFASSAKLGDIVEIGCELVSLGNTSITISCEVRNKDTKQSIIRIDKIVFVLVDENGKPKPHGIIK
jgi:acyl-CoA thioesterase YciA